MYIMAVFDKLTVTGGSCNRAFNFYFVCCFIEVRELKYCTFAVPEISFIID